MGKDQPQFEREAFQEKAEEMRVMKERIERSLRDEETRSKVVDDFVYTFEQLGLSNAQAAKLYERIVALLSSDRSLADIEAEVLRILQGISIGDAKQNMVDVLHEKLRDRARIIAAQVAPHLGDVKERAIDYGAGDGQVTQILHDQLGLDIEGVDVLSYKAPNVTVPIMLFNGGHVEAKDGAYEAGLLTNVLHHEKMNEKIFDELNRIVRRKLVILETVPVGDFEEAMEQDKDRTFMNDYLYNRLFHNADVPVPGTFDTPKGWIDRFARHGWNVVHEKDLGFDQPTIKDRHYLFVFERERNDKETSH